MYKGGMRFLSLSMTFGTLFIHFFAPINAWNPSSGRILSIKIVRYRFSGKKWHKIKLIIVVFGSASFFL